MAQSPNKTIASQPLAWTTVTSGSVNVGSAIDVSSKWAAAFGIRIARRSGTTFTAGWPNIRIEYSTSSGVNNSWIPLYTYQPQIGASIANTSLSGAVSVGASTFAVTSATNISVGDLLFLGDSSTGNFEIVRVKSVSGTTITPEEVIVNAHANGAIVTDQAEIVTPQFDLSMITRLRCVVDNANSGQDISVEISLITQDSFGQ